MAPYSKMGNTKKVLSLLQEMQDNNLLIDGRVYQTVIRAFLQSGDEEGATKYFKKWEEEGQLHEPLTYIGMLLETNSTQINVKVLATTGFYWRFYYGPPEVCI
jgi:pentatricopeptide repeat protein